MQQERRFRPVGLSGGRRVKRDFWFAPAEGNLFPSESESIANGSIVPYNMPPSWSWAVNHALINDLWIVIPMQWETDAERRHETNTVRSSVWRTGKTRRGVNLMSQVWDRKMYIRPT
jgi:hypothetical protein